MSPASGNLIFTVIIVLVISCIGKSLLERYSSCDCYYFYQ
jgi:hypothetical protein